MLRIAVSLRAACLGHRAHLHAVRAHASQPEPVEASAVSCSPPYTVSS